MGVSRKVASALVIVALVVGVVIGFLSSYFGAGVNKEMQTLRHLTRDAEIAITHKLLGEISGGSIREHLRYTEFLLISLIQSNLVNPGFQI